MLDLNHILLFIAIVSPVILLARIARLRNSRNHGWRIASVVVLSVCALAWWVVPSLAGFIGGAFWALLLIVPSITERKIEDLFLARRFARARRFAVVRQILHPWNDFAYRPSLLRCLEFATAGRLDLALDQLAPERAQPTPAGRFATALTFALTENWPGLAQWYRDDFSLAADPAISSLYLRGLGEIGALDDLIVELAARAESWTAPLTNNSPRAYNLAIALAFCGQTPDLVRLLGDRLGQISPGVQQFWIATAEMAEGRSEAGRARLEQLREATRDVVLQRSIDRRLSPTAKSGQLSARRKVFLEQLVTEMVRTQKETAQPRAGRAPAVWALIVLNIAMFGVELMLGGATNIRTLQLLGALEPDAVIVRHEYWRLLTALFLHYGALHLAFNLYALYLLGPELERIVGSFKFTISYLIAGLGSSAGVVLLRAIHLTNADLLVGASGCVMGVIGVSFGLLLRHRQTPLAGRRLRNIVVIVALQTAFDLSTPQVSLAAHLSGFVTGVGIGMILATRRHRLPV